MERPPTFEWPHDLTPKNVNFEAPGQFQGIGCVGANFIGPSRCNLTLALVCIEG